MIILSALTQKPENHNNNVAICFQYHIDYEVVSYESNYFMPKHIAVLQGVMVYHTFKFIIFISSLSSITSNVVLHDRQPKTERE